MGVGDGGTGVAVGSGVRVGLTVAVCVGEDGGWMPDGLDYHVAFGSEGNVRVSEVWDSKEQFDAFGKRLMPLLKEAGIELEGPPELIEVQNIEKR